MGALLFLMDKMYTLNPQAKMVLLLGSSFKYAEGLSNFRELVNAWHIPLIDLWGKINIAPPFLPRLRAGEDDYHPSTFAHEIMGNMLTHDILTI